MSSIDTFVVKKLVLFFRCSAHSLQFVFRETGRSRIVSAIDRNDAHAIVQSHGEQSLKDGYISAPLTAVSVITEYSELASGEAHSVEEH